MFKSSPQSEQSPPDMWTCFEHLSSLRHPLCFCRIIAESCQNQLFQSLDAKSAKETWWLGPGLCGDLLRLILIQQLSFTAENSWLWRASILYLISWQLVTSSEISNILSIILSVLSTVRRAARYKIYSVTGTQMQYTQVFFPENLAHLRSTVHSSCFVAFIFRTGQ